MSEANFAGSRAILGPEILFDNSNAEREKLVKNRGGFGVKFGSG